MLKQKSKSPSSILRSLLLVTSLAVLAVGLSPFVAKQKTALAATNGTINFQARLLTAAGNIVPDGQYNVEFKLYGAASGGSPLWTETRIGTDKVTVKNGYLTVNLGSVTAFGSGINWDQELWLTMNIGGTGSPAWDGEMNPRLKLTSVPYAFRSGAVVSADGTGVLIAANGETGTICVRNSTSCGFVQGVAADFIQNSTSPQTANISITSSLGTSSAMTIQGASDASVPVAIIKGGSAPGSAADVLQLQDSSDKVLFKVDNDGDAELARSLKIGYASGVTEQLNIQGPSGQFVVVNAASNKFYVGDNANCSGRFCVGYNLNGAGGSTYTNAHNVTTVSVSSASTFIGQDIKISDTSSSSVANLIRGMRIDTTGTNNTGATLNSFQIFIPTTSSVSSYGGNAIQVQQANLTNIFRIANTGQATFQSTNTTTSAFQILNSGGSAMFTLNTSGTNNGIYIGGTGGNAGGRLYFGSTSDANVWIGEEGTTDTNILTLNGSNGLKIYAGGRNVADFSDTGALNLSNKTNSTQAFSVKTAEGNNLLTVDTMNSRVGINLGSNNTPLLAFTGLEVNGAIRISGTGADTFKTPAGANVGSKINIPVFSPGEFGQVLALGVGPITQSNPNTARVISLFDARLEIHQPTLAVFNPNESDAIGFSWDGSNTMSWIKSLGADIGIRANTTNIALFKSAGIDLFQDTAISSGKILTVGGTLRASTINAGSSGETISIGTSAQGIDLKQDTAIAPGKGFTAQGTATFKNASDSSSAFRIINSTNTALFTVNTSSTNTGIYVAGTGTGGGGSRVFFGPTGDTAVWIGEDSTTNTNILTLNGNSGMKLLTSNGDVTIDAGTGTINIGAAAQARTINLGTGLATQTVNMGSYSGTSTTTIQGATITVGSSTSTSTSNLRGSTVNIGASGLAGDATIVNIANAAGGTQNVYIGNNIGTSSVAINGGSLLMGATDNNHSISIGTGNAVQTVTIGSTNTTSTTKVYSGSGGTTFKSADGTTAFRILNGSDVPLFTVDSTNDRVYIGNPNSDTTGALLVLDTKSGAGDPVGVAGGMYYNAALKKMRCYEGDGYWVDCRPSVRSGYFYSNDFIGFLNGGQVGETMKTVVSNSGAIGGVDGEAGHPGILIHSVAGQSNSSSAVLSRYQDSILLGNGDAWRFEAMAQLNAWSDSVNTYTFRAGFMDSDGTSGGESTDGCYIRYTNASATASAGKWTGVCRSGGSESTCDTSVAPATLQWYKLEVVVNAAGTSADFKVNGASSCQVTSNIPTGSSNATGFGTSLIKNSGSTGRNVRVDYIEVNGTLGGAR